MDFFERSFFCFHLFVRFNTLYTKSFFEISNGLKKQKKPARKTGGDTVSIVNALCCGKLDVYKTRGPLRETLIKQSKSQSTLQENRLKMDYKIDGL
jgi:hypothetical protein